MLVPFGGAELSGACGSGFSDSDGEPELLLGSGSEFPSEFPPELASELPSEVPSELDGEGGSESSGCLGAFTRGPSEVVTEL